MNNFTINYNNKGFVRNITIASSVYATVFGLYISISQALIPNYSFLFYASLLLITISVVLLLSQTVWQAKPFVIISTDFFETNIPGQNKIAVELNSVSELSIGVSNIIFKTTDSKQYNADLSSLKYSDIKKIKSKLIELCEEKKTPYHNNY